MQNRFHKDLLKIIRETSGSPTKDEYLNNYLGSPHVRYPINAPTLRMIAKMWMGEHRELEPETFAGLLGSLIKGKSSTEKMMAGILMDYSSKHQRNFDPKVLDDWLEHLVGWAEVDAVCTGDFIASQLPAYWPQWKTLITRLSKSSNINKRRASLVLFCSPVSRIKNDTIADVALKTITKCQSEKDVMITKAISWVLRSLVKHHRQLVSEYVSANAATLPKIAVRETMVKLETGKKTKRTGVA